MRINLFTLLACGLLSASLAGAMTGGDQPPASPALAESCAACHEDLAAGFGATAHGRSFAYDDNQAAASCRSCHGDTTAHVASGDPADIRNPAKLDANAVNASCLSCHGENKSHAAWDGSQHELAGVSCVDCHAVHHATPSRRGVLAVGSRMTPTTALCLSCHTSERKTLHQRSSHPLDEGKMDCASCHAPHGGTGEHLIAADSVNDLCLSCHQEKRGPFLWEHSPVRESCLTCHTSHGSNQDMMLVTRTNQLCQSCHMQGRHQTVAGLPNEAWNSNRACINCHGQIHGSNHPSGVLFQR